MIPLPSGTKFRLISPFLTPFFNQFINISPSEITASGAELPEINVIAVSLRPHHFLKQRAAA